MILSFACCNVSVAPVRREPAHRSEQVTQLLFGEGAEVLEIESHDWARIRTTWDGYEGWVRSAQVQFLPQKEQPQPPRQLANGHYDRLVFGDHSVWLPAGSEPGGRKSSHMLMDGVPGKFKGKKINIHKLTPAPETVSAAAGLYLHAPYQWGGRTTAGIDCSGLSQLAYKRCGIVLPRDASQQAQVGQTIDFLVAARCGDLAFFDNAEGRIVHVGILLDNQTILHATENSGRVVIDRIDGGGIISLSLKKRTHNLRLIKRMLSAGKHG